MTHYTGKRILKPSIPRTQHLWNALWKKTNKKTKKSQFILAPNFQEPLPTWHFLIWAWFPGSWIRFLNALQSSVFWGKIASCHSILISMSLISLAASCNLEPKLFNFLSTATSVAWIVFKFLLKIKHKKYIKTTLRARLLLTKARKFKVKASHWILTLSPFVATFPSHLLGCRRPLTFHWTQWYVKTFPARSAAQQVHCERNIPGIFGSSHVANFLPRCCGDLRTVCDLLYHSCWKSQAPLCALEMKWEALTLSLLVLVVISHALNVI